MQKFRFNKRAGEEKVDLLLNVLGWLAAEMDLGTFPKNKNRLVISSFGEKRLAANAMNCLEFEKRVLRALFKKYPREADERLQKFRMLVQDHLSCYLSDSGLLSMEEMLSVLGKSQTVAKLLAAEISLIRGEENA